MNKLLGVFTGSIRRRILTSYAVVILLVAATAIAGYFQLRQIGRSAREMIPASARMGHLQDLALATSSLEADLERFFVIGGAQFQEAVFQDIQSMTGALEAMQENASTTVQPDLLELAQAESALTTQVRTLVETGSSDLTSGEVNQRILSIYSQIDAVKQLEQALTAETQSQLSDTVGAQEQLAMGVITGFVVLGLAISLIAVLSSLFATSSIASPLTGLADTASRIAAGELDLAPTIKRQDEIGVLAQSFESMTTQLRTLIGGLEQRVAERTADLEQRSAYLQASAEVGYAVSSILDADQLTEQVVELVREYFSLYYVGLFLTDEAQEWAVLRAGTGQTGQATLPHGRRIKVGEGVVGRCIAQAQAHVSTEAGAEDVHLATDDLPDTRSEAALPLRSRGRIIGALNVHHTQAGAFDEDAIVALQTMADQIAVALDNASLFQQAEESLEAERRAYSELSRQAWRELLRTQWDLGVLRDGHGISRSSKFWTAQMETALRQHEAVTDNEGDAVLALPISVRGQIIGVVDVQKPSGAGAWTQEEITTMQALVDQLGAALDGARLYQDTQRRAARERTVSEITARMRQTLDIETVLQTTAGEVRQALDLDSLVIRLATPETGGDSNSARERT